MRVSLASLDSPGALVAAGLVSRESADLLQAYVELLERWQRRINLIGPGTVGQVWSRHIADCLQLVTLLPKEGAPIADLGSGAGLPGAVLAIALKDAPRTHVHLIEATAKKAAFLREAVRVLELPASVHAVRIEAIDSAALQPAPEFVTARALAPTARLIDLSRKFVENGAVGLFLKGQDVDSELTDSPKCWRIRAEKIPSPFDGGGTILKVEEVHSDARVP